MISENKSADQQTSVDRLWKAFMSAPDSETYKKGKPILQSKVHLTQVLTELEADNLVMYSTQDGEIVLI